eukprot:276893-Pleurochrysis_carterae.AAC.1
MTAVDVLSALMVLRVKGQVDRAFVVHGERRRRGLLQAELGEERAEVDGLLNRFGGRDNLGLARGEGHA